MKKKASFTIFLCFLLAIPVCAQVNAEYKKTFAQAERLFEDENYPAALPLYQRLDSMSPGNQNTAFKIGFCYLNSSTYKTKSIPHFEKAIKNINTNYKMGDISETAAPSSSFYYLGKAYHLNYEFDKAIAMYERYRSELGTDPKVKADVDDVNHDIETCKFGKELVQKPRKLTITNLGEGVNSKYPDYSPVVSLDEQILIFTSRREGGINKDKEPNGQFSEDILISTYSDGKWSTATPIGPAINSIAHEASINLSADGQKLLIYKDDNGDGNIYESLLKGDSWSPAVKVAAPINSSSWESHACYTADNRILYFVSDRPGGIGGRDIYKCLRLPNGEWGPVQNLGNVINTPYDEDGVFIHPDGRQIFFSSKGHQSMGGFDIFTSFMDDENGFWTTPVNYGYPVNTTDDDVFLVTTADGVRAFFSSDKEGGFGEKDIYMITFPESEPRDITILVGKFDNPSGEDIANNEIEIINTKTNETLQVLNANSTTGKFGTNLPVGNTYRVIYRVNGQELLNEVVDVPAGKRYNVIRKDITYHGKNGPDALAGKNAPGNNKADKGDNKAYNDSIARFGLECQSRLAPYMLTFQYNRKEIDPRSAEFKSFIDALSVCIGANPLIVIELESSASNVPTRTFKNNEELAALRAKEAKNKILQALLKKGVKESDIHFAEPISIVQGPPFKDDAADNKAVYEQYQYIKVHTGLRK